MGSDIESNLYNLPLCSRWDLQAQTPHGGQEWQDIPNFIEDFSVTTNALGTPRKALEMAMLAGKNIHHYPSSDQEPALSSLARFLVNDIDFLTSSKVSDNEEYEDIRRRLILGNGASELIDLCIRISHGKSWRPGPFRTQYKEYERSATNYGKTMCSSDDKSAELLCIVNPCNPTGDFLELKEIISFIEKCADRTTVIVDESMLPWFGKDWRDQSLVSQRNWIARLFEKREVSVFIIHSWTKIWACPGIRLGSVIAPTVRKAELLKKMQVPWSLNCFAISFLSEVVHDVDYMEKTWKVTAAWREEIERKILELFPFWIVNGVKWQSFLWVDTGSAEVAELCVNECRENGVPIRWGKHGYDLPTYIRIAVRDPKTTSVLQDVFKMMVYKVNECDSQLRKIP